MDVVALFKSEKLKTLLTLRAFNFFKVIFALSFGFIEIFIGW